MNVRLLLSFVLLSSIAFARQVQFHYDFKHVAVTPGLEKQLRAYLDSIDQRQHMLTANDDSNNVFCVLDDSVVQNMREYCEAIDVQLPNVEYRVAVLRSKSPSGRLSVEPIGPIPAEAETIGFSAIQMNTSFQRRDRIDGIETVVRLTPKGTADRYDTMELSVETAGQTPITLSLKPTAALVRNVEYLGARVDMYVTTRLIDTRGNPWQSSTK